MPTKEALMQAAAKLWSAATLLRGSVNHRELETQAHQLDLLAIELARQAASNYYEVKSKYPEEVD